MRKSPVSDGSYVLEQPVFRDALEVEEGAIQEHGAD